LYQAPRNILLSSMSLLGSALNCILISHADDSHLKKIKCAKPLSRRLPTVGLPRKFSLVKLCIVKFQFVSFLCLNPISGRLSLVLAHQYFCSGENGLNVFFIASLFSHSHDSQTFRFIAGSSLGSAH
jgi:hypothetical protein